MATILGHGGPLLRRDCPQPGTECLIKLAMRIEVNPISFA